MPKTVTTPIKYSDLTEEQKERRRAAQRKYRATHKEKVREWNRTFYLRQAAKLLQENARAAAAAGEGDAQ
jgi:hypothetical protein